MSAMAAGGVGRLRELADVTQVVEEWKDHHPGIPEPSRAESGRAAPGQVKESI